MTAHIGAFNFARALGSGGMGSVFEGVHRPSSAPVVMKTVRVDLSGDLGRRRHAFQYELEAIARMHHPRVVQVHDFGVIDEDTCIDGAVVTRGSPFIIMARVDGAPIHTLGAPVWSWRALRPVVTELLETLAHVHARGVVHRDIKPDNVLLEHATGRAILIDFGVAHLRARKGELSGGTPPFMAPEQLEGVGYGKGPWTDVYALGCMIHELLVGRPLFVAPSLLELIELKATGAHDIELLRQALPSVARWGERAVAPQPELRFSCAAHALAALPQADESHATADLFEEDGSIDLWNLSTIATDPSPSPMTSAAPEVGHGARDGVPLPTSWQTQEEGFVGAPLRGAGLGLLKLRALPLLGRTTSRDHLWARALEVESTRGLRGVSLVGFAGAGKSALARWLTTRAHELAGWTHVWISCDASRSCEEVLLAGLEALLGTGALITRTDAHRRLTRRLDLDSGVLHALTEALRPSTPNSGAIDVALLAHVLAGIGASSPLLLVLDDAHAIHDGLGAFVRALRHACEGVGARVLVLVTASLEQEQSDERVRALIDELGFERHDVGPLDPASHARLVGSVLDLSAEERARLLELTRGNPFHSLHVLEHWIGHSNLVATDAGFARRDETAFTWPEHLDDVCAQRARNAVNGPGDTEPAWLSLHSAALLGQELTWSEWEGVCAGKDPGALLDSMVHAGLAERTPGGWRFTSGLMRAHLEASCRARGQWNDAHGACARALVDDGPRSAQTWRRVAHHRFSSDQWAAGLDALEHGFYDLTLTSCEAALTDLEAQLPEAPDPMLDARVELVRCHVALMRGELEQTGTRLSRIGARIEERGWDGLRERWVSLSIELALFTGEVDGGITLARAHLERLGGDPDGTWQRLTCLRQLAELHQSVHHLDEAADALEEAMRLTDGRHPWQAAWIAHNLASIDQERGRYTHAHA